MMKKIKAFRIFEQKDSVQGKVVEMDVGSLDEGDVIVEVKFSSVNFKDALAGTGQGKIIRKFPCNGGIDLAGVVVSSTDSSLQEGDEVLATSYGIGVDHDGGFAEMARIPAKWVLPIPKGLSLYDSMCLGTAGLTAGMAVHRLESSGLSKEKGPVVVTGATGGVGSIAIDILSQKDYEVTALTGKKDEVDYLKSIGATKVLFRDDLDLKKIRPLGKEIWAGAVDNLGGDVLSLITTQMKWGGVVSVIGLAASHQFNGTVMPFILRNVGVLGIDSVNAPMANRKKIWSLLGTDLKPKNLSSMVTTVRLDELPSVFEKIMQGKIKGRTVVEFNS